MHKSLRAAIADLQPQDLATPPPGRKGQALDMLVGVAAHDIYHAGQIQLLKRLRKGA